MIDKLNSGFINTWIIIPQFNNPEKFYDDTNARSWAKVIADEFTYPVDSIILSPDGELIAQLEFGRGNSTSGYLKLINSEPDEKP